MYIDPFWIALFSIFLIAFILLSAYFSIEAMQASDDAETFHEQMKHWRLTAEMFQELADKMTKERDDLNQRLAETGRLSSEATEQCNLAQVRVDSLQLELDRALAELEECRRRASSAEEKLADEDRLFTDFLSYNGGD